MACEFHVRAFVFMFARYAHKLIAHTPDWYILVYRQYIR